MFELELPLTFLKHHSRPVTSISRRSSKEDACRAEVIAIAENAMGCPLPDANVTVVRDVSGTNILQPRPSAPCSTSSLIALFALRSFGMLKAMMAGRGERIGR